MNVKATAIFYNIEFCFIGTDIYNKIPYTYLNKDHCKKSLIELNDNPNNKGFIYRIVKITRTEGREIINL